MNTIIRVANWIADTAFRDRSRSWKAAAMTSLWTFVGVLLMSGSSFLSAVIDWLESDDLSNPEQLIDDLALLAKAVLSGFVAFVTGLLNYVFRWLQEASGRIPGEGPSFYPDE